MNISKMEFFIFLSSGHTDALFKYVLIYAEAHFMSKIQIGKY